MKAIRIARPGGPEVLELADVPDPEPGMGAVLVRVRAAGVNRADLLQRRGAYPAPAGAPADIPGLEFAGEVVRVAAGIEGWRPGDRVMGILGGGGYAELAAAPASTLLPIPADLSWIEAAAIPEVFLTAADALLSRGRLAPGERVLVHSAGGGVGSAAIQLARLAGASLVLGTASGEKLSRLESIGVPLDAGIDYRRESFARVVAERTSGAGVDVLLDTVGALYWDDNLASLAPLGRLVVVGLLGGGVTRADLGVLMRRRLTVVGTVLRSRPVPEKAELTESFRCRFLPAFDDGRLRPILDRALPLERAAEAHATMEANRNVGKIVLEVS